MDCPVVTLYCGVALAIWHLVLNEQKELDFIVKYIIPKIKPVIRDTIYT